MYLETKWKHAYMTFKIATTMNNRKCALIFLLRLISYVLDIYHLGK